MQHGALVAQRRGHVAELAWLLWLTLPDWPLAIAASGKAPTGGTPPPRGAWPGGGGLARAASGAGRRISLARCSRGAAARPRGADRPVVRLVFLTRWNPESRQTGPPPPKPHNRSTTAGAPPARGETTRGQS